MGEGFPKLLKEFHKAKGIDILLKALSGRLYQECQILPGRSKLTPP
jgi:hypothetical protein